MHIFALIQLETKKNTHCQLVNLHKLYSNNVSFSVIVSSPAEFQSRLSQSAFENLAIAAWNLNVLSSPRWFRVSLTQGWILDIDREKVLLEMMHVTCIYLYNRT